MDIDNKGMPTKVHVVKNLAFTDASIDIIISSTDFMQIGKLEGTANPNDYSISHKP